MRIRSQHLATRRVGDDVMILDLKSSKYFAVGGSGIVILDLLGDRDVTVDDIVRELTGSFAVDAERARADAEVFLHRLDAAGLLERGEPGTSMTGQP